MVANNNPLDQYLMRHPESFFGKSHESARISPANPYVMKPHLICAAYEAPLTMNDTEFFGHEMLWYADELIEDEYLHVRHGRWHLLPEVTYPAERVNIRSASGAFYTLVESETGAILETVSEETAFMQLHPGAIYLHQGESYLIKDLDLDSHTAYCSITDAPYYTQVRDYTETRILNTYKSRQVGEVSVFLGEVNVSTHVVGFKRVKHQTEEVLGDEYVELPPQEYETTALWFTPDRYTLGRIHDEKLDLAGALQRGGARGYRASAAVRDVRPQRHRWHLDSSAPGYGQAAGVHPRRTPGRGRGSGTRLRGHRGPMARHV